MFDSCTAAADAAGKENLLRHSANRSVLLLLAGILLNKSLPCGYFPAFALQDAAMSGILVVAVNVEEAPLPGQEKPGLYHSPSSRLMPVNSLMFVAVAVSLY